MAITQYSQPAAVRAGGRGRRTLVVVQMRLVLDVAEALELMLPTSSARFLHRLLILSAVLHELPDGHPVGAS